MSNITLKDCAQAVWMFFFERDRLDQAIAENRRLAEEERAKIAAAKARTPPPPTFDQIVESNDNALKVGAQALLDKKVINEFTFRELNRKIEKMTMSHSLGHVRSNEKKKRTLIKVQISLMSCMASILFAKAHLDALLMIERIDNTKYHNSMFNIRYHVTRMVEKAMWDGESTKLSEDFETLGKELTSFVVNMENYAIRKAGMNAWDAHALRSKVAVDLNDSLRGGSPTATNLMIDAIDTVAALSYGAGSHY